jgi:hypothetical protein
VCITILYTVNTRMLVSKSSYLSLSCIFQDFSKQTTCTVVVAQLDVVKKLKRVLCSSPDDVVLKWQNKISADSVKRVSP